MFLDIKDTRRIKIEKRSESVSSNLHARNGTRNGRCISDEIEGKGAGRDREPRGHKFHGCAQGVYTTHPRRVKREKSFQTGEEGLSRTMSQLRGLHGAKIIRAGE